MAGQSVLCMVYLMEYSNFYPINIYHLKPERWISRRHIYPFLLSYLNNYY